MNTAANIIPFPGSQQDAEYCLVKKSDLQAMISEAAAQAVRQFSGERTISKKNHHMTADERSQKLSPYKSNGVKKATAAVAIRDLAKVKAIREYFLSSGKVREYSVFSVGLTLGIRAKDLLNLQIRDFINPDLSFKDRLDVIEMKTDKRNRPLLTDYAKQAILTYLETRNKPKMDDYMFVSRNKLPDGRNAPLSLSLLNENLAAAGETVGLHLSSHCMRHTFSLYMNLYARSETESNLSYMSLMVTQMAMNHANLSQTLAYTGLSQDMMDEKRIALSSFLLENT